MKKVIFISMLLSMLFLYSCDKSNLTMIEGPDRIIYIAFNSLSGENLFEKLKVDTFQNTKSLHLNKEEYELELFLDGMKVDANPIRVSSENNALHLRFGCGHCDEMLSEKRDYFYEYRFVCPKIFGDDRARIITAKCVYVSKRKYRNREITFDGQIICQSNDCGLAGEGILNVTVN